MGAMGINQAAKTLDVTMAKYDMHVECPGVPMKTRLSNRHGTTLEMAKGQLAVSMESKDPIPEALDDTCGELLKQAVTTFRLGQQQIATIIERGAYYCRCLQLLCERQCDGNGSPNHSQR